MIRRIFHLINLRTGESTRQALHAFSSALLLLTGGLNATELKPWFGDQYEYEFRAPLTYQHYHSLAIDQNYHHYPSDDLFLNLSLSNSPSPDFSAEVEMLICNTSASYNGLDCLRLTGRYLWLDDVAGDPISFVTGATLTEAFKGSLNDISCFHHGRNEAEVHVSIGRETSQGELWKSHWWGVAAIGVADKGSPWLRANAAYEVRLGCSQELGFFVDTLWGLGHQRLRPNHFHGYGPVKHQSADFSIRYNYLIELVGSISAKYSYRVYARNFPSQAQLFTLEFYYPFEP